MDYQHQVIDGHFHIYRWFEEDGGSFFSSVDAYREARNFCTININALPGFTRDVSNNMMAALYKLRHPQVYAHGGLMYPSYPVPERMPEGLDFLTQYRELMAVGFDGIKMLETKPDFHRTLARPANDPVYEDFFAAIERAGTHMVWHVADPETFWDEMKILPEHRARGWFYGDGTYAAKEEIYRQVFDVLDRHPGLKITFAHFFFLAFDPERLERVFLKYPGVNVDLTPGTEMYQAFGQRYEYYRDFFIRHADRIQFGTDASDQGDLTYKLSLPDTVYQFITGNESMEKWHFDFHGLNLDKPAADKILCQNFLHRVGSVPKPVNRQALAAYISKYLPYVKDEKVRHAIEKEADTL